MNWRLFVLVVNSQVSEFCARSGILPATGQQSQTSNLCSSLEIGLIPQVTNMVSTIITEPLSGSRFSKQQPLTLRFSTINFNSGFRANLDNQYLSIPQALAKNGQIKGFEQVAIESLDNNSGVKLNTFAVITKGTQRNGKSNYEMVINANTLPTGLVRICTMAASTSGQDVVMPVAQRGSTINRSSK